MIKHVEPMPWGHSHEIVDGSSGWSIYLLSIDSVHLLLLCY